MKKLQRIDVAGDGVIPARGSTAIGCGTRPLCAGCAPEPVRRLEVFTGSGRRRAWTAGCSARRRARGLHRSRRPAEEFQQRAQPRRLFPKLKEIIPSYGEFLIEDADLSRRVRAKTARVLHLEYV
jgi:hypothetical protein